MHLPSAKLNTKAALLSFGCVFGFQLDLLEKNLITLMRVTFTENDLMQGGSLNHSNADYLHAFFIIF